MDLKKIHLSVIKETFILALTVVITLKWKDRKKNPKEMEEEKQLLWSQYLNDKVDFKEKLIRRVKEEQLIVFKRTIYQKDIMI